MKLKQTTLDSFFKLEKTNPNETENSLICFTDGSCINNGSPNAKAAWAILWPYHPEYNKSEKNPPSEIQTNNRAEYRALIHALKTADEIDPSQTKTLINYTDSQLLINSITEWMPQWKKNNWRKRDNSEVLNLDLLKELDTLITTRKLILRYVAAHTGNNTWEAIHNDKVDKLARSSFQPKNKIPIYFKNDQ